MNPNDQIGILAFDAAWDWTLPFRPVGNGEWVNDKLAALRSDGGTDMYKAMVEARRVMIAKEAAIKHVIVLSDGLTDKADFQPLVQELAQAGVTVSTVSVGERFRRETDGGDRARGQRPRLCHARSADDPADLHHRDAAHLARSPGRKDFRAARGVADGTAARNRSRRRCRSCAAMSSPIPSSAPSCS